MNYLNEKTVAMYSGATDDFTVALVGLRRAKAAMEKYAGKVPQVFQTLHIEGEEAMMAGDVLNVLNTGCGVAIETALMPFKDSIAMAVLTRNEGSEFTAHKLDKLITGLDEMLPLVLPEFVAPLQTFKHNLCSTPLRVLQGLE